MAIDADRGLDPVDADAIVSDGRTVYASPTSLYVASERWDAPGRLAAADRDDDRHPPLRHRKPDPDALPRQRLRPRRAPEPMVALRARQRPFASRARPTWWGGPGTENETVVTTLAASGGALVPLGRVGGLGKGERVCMIRFVGDTGYVVATARSTRSTR